MPRRTPSIPPPVRQGDAETNLPGIQSQLAALDRLEARQRDQDTDDLEELRGAWAPALSQAKAILAELVALEVAYGPSLQAIEGRDFARLPQVATTMNAVAGIERSCQQLQHEFGHTMEDLRRIIDTIEKLNERSAPLLHSNSATFRELLGFYRHTPRGVRELFQRLERLVATLTEGLEVVDETEGYTPMRRLPAPQPLTPEVEMA
jgi:hypothetical protein